MGDLEAKKIDNSPATIYWDIRGEGESKDDIYEDWESKPCCEPGEVSSVWEEVALFVLFVNSWKERVD